MNVHFGLFAMQFYANFLCISARACVCVFEWILNWNWCMLIGAQSKRKGNTNMEGSIHYVNCKSGSQFVSIVIYSHILTWYLNYDDSCMRIHLKLCFALKLYSYHRINHENKNFSEWIVWNEWIKYITIAKVLKPNLALWTDEWTKEQTYWKRIHKRKWKPSQVVHITLYRGFAFTINMYKFAEKRATFGNGLCQVQSISWQR